MGEIPPQINIAIHPFVPNYFYPHLFMQSNCCEIYKQLCSDLNNVMPAFNICHNAGWSILFINQPGTFIQN